jgi:hypothetical protein
MAGEILTRGISAPSITATPATLTGLDYVNISHVVGMMTGILALDFKIGQSNKMRCRVYYKNLGSSTWNVHTTFDLDSTGGSAQSRIFGAAINAAWMVAIMPLQNVTRSVTCAIHIKPYSDMSLNKDKKLRICNNMKLIINAAITSFIGWDTVPTLPTSESHRMTTSVGTLMKDGQYIFGQN